MVYNDTHMVSDVGPRHGPYQRRSPVDAGHSITVEPRSSQRARDQKRARTVARNADHPPRHGSYRDLSHSVERVHEPLILLGCPNRDSCPLVG